MVDRLKSSLADLEAPTCANCRIEMKWYMSKLAPGEDVTTIVHQFVCPGCESVGKTETEFKSTPILPHKLLAPRTFTRAA
jgi:hypothetical protein